MTLQLRRSVFISLFFISILGQYTNVSGQGLGGGENSRIDGKYKFMPIPYVNYDRSMGFAVGAVPLLMFNPTEKDTISPSSLVGGVGMYTTNKTWFLMGFGMFYLGEDNWRVTTAGGIGTVNFQFYLDLVESWIPYQSEAGFFMFRLERRIYDKLYGGLSYIYADVITSTDILPISDTLTLHGLGFNLSLDKRDNPHYPRNGYYTSVKYNTFPGFFGNETVTQKIELETNHYFSTRQRKDVVAARFYSGIGLGDLAFSQQFIVMGKDIRGYTQGEFRGNYKLALQGEYRWNFHRRWGAVGFAGVATVFEGINESDNGKLLPGLGTGIRFTAFEENHFTVGLDVAAGINDWGIYFQIGQVF
ncbi:MAG: BamA/TamA family outer membrane protein [Bacteroidota bacterium]|nr:BamA/TamA family outer membrane protein [Bacteroidota bacterium]